MAHFGVQKVKSLAVAAGVLGAALLPLGSASAAKDSADYLIPESLQPNMIEIIGGGQSGGVTVGAGRKAWGEYGTDSLKDNIEYGISYSFDNVGITIYPKEGQTVAVKGPNGSTITPRVTESGNYNYHFENGNWTIGDYEITIGDGTNAKTYNLHLGEASESGATHEDDGVYFNFQNADGEKWQEEFIHYPDANGLQHRYTVKRPHGFDNVQIERIYSCATGSNAYGNCTATNVAPTASNIEEFQYSIKLGSEANYIALSADSPSAVTPLNDATAMYVKYVGGGAASRQDTVFVFDEYPYTLVDFTDGEKTERKQFDYVDDNGTAEADLNVEDLHLFPTSATCAKGDGSIDLKFGEMNTLICEDEDGTHAVNIDYSRYDFGDKIELEKGEEKKPSDIPDYVTGFFSNNEDVATVDEDGTIKAVGDGDALIVGHNIDYTKFFIWKVSVGKKTVNPDTLDSSNTALNLSLVSVAAAGFAALSVAARRFFGRK